MSIFNKDFKTEEQIHIYLSNPDQVLFNGNAMGFSSFNESGEFSVISKHTNFRSLIKNKIIIYIDGNQKKEFKISKGVLSFSRNKVEAYVV